MTVPPVPAAGRLEDRPLGEVLRGLLAERRDGCLTVTRRKVTRRLFIAGGMITAAASTRRQDRLGDILVAQGKITQEELERSWEQSREENRLLGITLVLNGRITLQDLYQGVSAQAVTILGRLQRWRAGEYAFEEGARPEPGTVLLRIPLALYLPAEHTVSGKCRVTPESAERIGEVSFLVQELSGRRDDTPRALLGIPADAGLAAAEKAYRHIEGVLGADSLPKGVGASLARSAADVLALASAALEAVTEEERRKTARKQQQEPAPPSRVREADEEGARARRFYRQGRAALEEKNYWAAADALRRAVRLRPEEAAYRHYLGLALSHTKRLHEAEEHLLEATRLEPGNADHFLCLGRIYRGGKLLAKARQALERAVRIDPGNEEARREFKELGGGPLLPPRPGGDSVLKKIFGKG